MSSSIFEFKSYQSEGSIDILDNESYKIEQHGLQKTSISIKNSDNKSLF